MRKKIRVKELPDGTYIPLTKGAVFFFMGDKTKNKQQFNRFLELVGAADVEIIKDKDARKLVEDSKFCSVFYDEIEKDWILFLKHSNQEKRFKTKKLVNESLKELVI